MNAWNLYRERGPEALWERALGFMDLDVEQTLDMQRRLMSEHLARVTTAPLWELTFGAARPRTLEELREQVPLTTYADYRETLGERRADLLHEPPEFWVKTSGRSGGPDKWVPMPRSFVDELAWVDIGLLLVSTADDRGQVTLREGTRVLNMTAPPPYGSGQYFRLANELWPFDFIPPLTPEVDQMTFDARTELSFQTAMREGVDIVTSLASVLAFMGEDFGSRRPEQSLRSRLRPSRTALRMARAAFRARRAGRSIAPMDVWSPRGVITGGMDSSLFRDRIRNTWGRYPTDLFGATETGVTALHAWDKIGLVLASSLNFFEFLPEDEQERMVRDAQYRPRTVLMDEIEVDQNYELVLTNLHGGPLARYRTGDIVRVTAAEHSGTGIRLPQLAHYARRTDLIELAGFVWLSEMTIWRAIDEAGIPHVDWTARKETEGDAPVLRLRIEPRPGAPDPGTAERAVHARLRALIPDWADMEDIGGLRPLRVTYLPPGSFERYTEQRVAAGAEFAHLKPQHMNASDDVIRLLVPAGESE